jgi:N-acetylneuraminate lyase
MSKHYLTGLVAAPFQAMQPDGSINLDRIERQADSLLKNGVAGAFVCGTTGEGLSLSVPERLQAAGRWKEVIGERDLRLVVQVGHNSVADSRTLAGHAQEVGAHAIGCMAPGFPRPAALEDLVAYCREVAAAAPGLPFYYYHIPSLTGVDFPMVEFLRQAGPRIPTLAGIKFTGEDLMDFGLCLEVEERKYDMLFGRDEVLLAGLSLGARGAIGSTYNYAAPLYHRILQSFQAGDLEGARADQVRSMEMVECLIRFGVIPAGKAIMKMIGLDCGPIRPPLKSLTEEQCSALRAKLEEIGFFDYCSKS